MRVKPGDCGVCISVPLAIPAIRRTTATATTRSSLTPGLKSRDCSLKTIDGASIVLDNFVLLGHLPLSVLIQSLHQGMNRLLEIHLDRLLTLGDSLIGVALPISK